MEFGRGRCSLIHSEACRTRIEAKLATTDEGQVRIARAKLRLDQASLQRSKPDDDVEQPAAQGELSESMRGQPATSSRAASSTDNPFELEHSVGKKCPASTRLLPDGGPIDQVPSKHDGNVDEEAFDEMVQQGAFEEVEEQADDSMHLDLMSASPPPVASGGNANVKACRVPSVREVDGRGVGSRVELSDVKGSCGQTVRGAVGLREPRRILGNVQANLRTDEVGIHKAAPATEPATSEAVACVRKETPRCVSDQLAPDAVDGVMESDEGLEELEKCVNLLQRDYIREDSAEIFNVLRQLGAGTASYVQERRKGINRIVSEIYSPPRVTAAAKLLPELRCVPGFAIDLTVEDEHGRPWDFDIADNRRRARQMAIEQKPMLLIGSPMCTAFSAWQYINNKQRDPTVVSRE